jgi:predicted ATP-dependent endonuclease of OLD family
MKIKSILINNWRSIDTLEANFEDISVIIGQNNHGKSNILSALLFFFGKIKPESKDLFNPNNISFVEIKFHDLDESDKITFKKYLDNEGNIKVRKIIATDLKFNYHGYLQQLEDEWLNLNNSSNYTNREIVSVTPLVGYIPESGRLTKAIIEEAQTRYIEENRENLNFTYSLEENNFLGLKTVAQSIFVDIFFIPAIKNANDELNPNKSNLFSELYSKILNRLAETNPVYIEARRQVNQLASILNKTTLEGNPNGERPDELNDFEENISQELLSWNTSIEVEISAPNIDDIFKVGTQIWINDGIKTDITRKGNGLQRALIFALIKAYSNIIREARQNIDEEQARQVSNSSYFIIEEPELFLHPQAQRDLHETLKLLSQTDNNQVILTTHSSSFIDLENYKSIIIAQKRTIEEGTKVKQCNEDLFASLDDRRKLNLIYWINPERSELFFAKKIILVEGQTDKTIIPYLAKKLSIFKNEYTIIDCGSKDNMPLYIKLLNGFKLRYVVVYDRDHQAHKNEQAINSANISTTNIEDALDENYGNSIVLINDIEEEIGIVNGSSKNKPYIALNLVSNNEYEIPIQIREKTINIYQ